MKSRAFRLAATYAAIAAAWLLFSDGALLLLRLSAEQIARFSVVKGFAFVLVTSVALYLLSDRFAMRAAAREREYRELFEQNPNPMWVYDVETLGFLAVNDAAVAKYGYSRDEFLAMTIADIRAPDHAGQPHGNVEVARTAAPEGFDAAGTWRHRTRSGQLLWVEITSHATEFDGYRAEFVLSVDVTAAEEVRQQLLSHQHDLEALVAVRTAQLERTNQRLAAATEAKSAFLATMSHELRTPLHSIIGFTSLLADEVPGPLNEEQHLQVGLVRDSGRRLLELINDILDLSRIEAGREEVVLERVRVAEVVRALERTVTPIAEAKGLAWAFEGPADEECEIVTDRRKVEQVLTNLMSNAIKYTSAGSVGLAAQCEADSVRFVIRDTGRGIDPEQREHIFTEFVRLQGDDTAPVEGTGLGLAISARLTRLLGGRLKVESSPGEGSVFTLVLPAQGPPQPSVEV